MYRFVTDEIQDLCGERRVFDYIAADGTEYLEVDGVARDLETAIVDTSVGETSAERLQVMILKDSPCVNFVPDIYGKIRYRKEECAEGTIYAIHTKPAETGNYWRFECVKVQVSDFYPADYRDRVL